MFFCCNVVGIIEDGKTAFGAKKYIVRYIFTPAFGAGYKRHKYLVLSEKGDCRLTAFGLSDGNRGIKIKKFS